MLHEDNEDEYEEGPLIGVLLVVFYIVFDASKVKQHIP